jgi:radical SAM protein with 4Fe4S-binding SPASM domain
MAFKEVATVDLLTNGTLVSEEIAHKLGRLKKLRCVQVSLDGASAECHDAIRGKGSFDRALSGIQLLRTNRVQVNIMFTLQRGNLREIGSIIDLATNQGVRFLTIERFVPAGAGSKTRSNVLSSEEIRSAFEYISMRADQQIAERGSTIITRSRPLWVLCDGDLMTDASERCNLGGICSLGIDGLCILPNGVVLPCRRLPIPIGDLKTDSITKIWHTSKLLYEIADKRNLKGKCKGCDLIGKCSGCRAMAFAITGDYLAEDPQCFKYK